ncbi:hypothetical protein HETIRDRAFT_438656 [Heterobasidion irregulare TC 32-1]|uniref:AAA+ ATPase domain-containing protein n=1 Tax=Heterobasidion irregulare (strain TC 32-1) TaxID=747525 RepID=W4KLH5_HETIT|nr:uncharacterized protein HETIRDRAFT_438656 [Heterobasidion irregulare TC 32-1]ETW86210.1 hypothetical protein HETIRDRAFT_438656 [Heterobasidion irregulare TC 32-1]
MFAIASDDVEEVRRVLESGEAGPNDQLGPQSALAFTLTNDRLMHKMEIVKELLAYGANPASLHNPEMNPPHSASIFASGSDHGREAGGWPLVVTPPLTTTMDGMNPATRYYISRADAPATRKTSALIHRSIFRPLTRMRYDIVGQDRVFEQLFMHLNEHSRRFSVSPIVFLFCGPSGHGKSLLAHKFGSLLGIPTHTVNMTSLRSTHDLWQSQSYQDMSPQTLSEFLLENEGKRCVVVLDEIEKVQDPKVHYSLLPAFEGRYFLHGPNRLVDMRNVVWLGTSNLGDQYVFEYQSTLSNPTAAMSREEYLDLIGLMRTKVTDQLGGGLIGRCTAVLPFVPFTEEEKIVIATEALLMHQADAELAEGLSAATLENAARKSLARYIPAEGARSLHRAVSAMLLDLF